MLATAQQHRVVRGTMNSLSIARFRRGGACLFYSALRLGCRPCSPPGLPAMRSAWAASLIVVSGLFLMAEGLVSYTLYNLDFPGDDRDEQP